MTISIGSNGIREWLSPGKPEHLPWYIRVGGFLAVIGMLVGMIVWEVAKVAWQQISAAVSPAVSVPAPLPRG